MAIALAMLTLPSAAALPPFLALGPEPAGDVPLPEFVEAAQEPTPEWQSTLIDRVVNLTWEYLADVDPSDNTTEQMHKAENYMRALEMEAKTFIPPGSGLCLQFREGGVLPGKSSNTPNPWIHLEIDFGHYVFSEDEQGILLC